MLWLSENEIGDKGAIALADAVKATCAMCFSSVSKNMFFWPSLTQSPEFNHLSTLEQTRTLMWKGVDVLLCPHRVRCGVRCGCSPLHRARSKMLIHVSFMDVLLAILVCVAEILRRGAFAVLSES